MTVLNHSAHYHRAVLLFALAAIVCSFDGRIGAQTRDNSVDVSRASTAEADFFESRIRPLLLARCIECHGAKKQESGLRLDSRDNVLKGNDEGPVVLLKQPEQSRLLHAVQQDGEIKMPPNGKLTGDQIAALAEWIKLGLPWPEGHGGVLDPAEAISAKARLHWAFKPVGAPSCQWSLGRSGCDHPSIASCFRVSNPRD